MFNTSCRCVDQKSLTWWYVLKTSWKYLSQQTFVLMKTSWRCLSSSSSEDVLIKTNMFALALRLQKTSWSRPIYLSWPYVFKTSSRRFQDAFQTFEDVFKMSSRPLQDVLQRYLQDVFKAYHPVNLFYLTRPREVFNTFLSTEEFA